jgi:hypothetical protein
MRLFFYIIGGLLMLATLATLMVGVISMGKGSDFNKRNANKLMRLRVILQGLALVCFVLGWMAG